jgi:hypothetical protein
MSDPHEQHAQAVAFAGAELEGLRNLLYVAHEKAEQAIGAVFQAVGQEPVESARNAVEHTAHVRDQIRELTASIEVAIGELQRYRGGF